MGRANRAWRSLAAHSGSPSGHRGDEARVVGVVPERRLLMSVEIAAHVKAREAEEAAEEAAREAAKEAAEEAEAEEAEAEEAEACLISWAG